MEGSVAHLSQDQHVLIVAIAAIVPGAGGLWGVAVQARGTICLAQHSSSRVPPQWLLSRRVPMAAWVELDEPSGSPACTAQNRYT